MLGSAAAFSFLDCLPSFAPATRFLSISDKAFQDVALNRRPLQNGESVSSKTSSLLVCPACVRRRTSYTQIVATTASDVDSGQMSGDPIAWYKFEDQVDWSVSSSSSASSSYQASSEQYKYPLLFLPLFPTFSLDFLCQHALLIVFRRPCFREHHCPRCSVTHASGSQWRTEQQRQQ